MNPNLFYPAVSLSPNSTRVERGGGASLEPCFQSSVEAERAQNVAQTRFHRLSPASSPLPKAGKRAKYSHPAAAAGCFYRRSAGSVSNPARAGKRPLRRAAMSASPARQLPAEIGKPISLPPRLGCVSRGDIWVGLAP